MLDVIDIKLCNAEPYYDDGNSLLDFIEINDVSWGLFSEICERAIMSGNSVVITAGAKCMAENKQNTAEEEISLPASDQMQTAEE